MAPPKTSCSVAGCNRIVAYRGMCDSHYRRTLRYGSPESGRAIRGSVLQWVRSHLNHTGEGCLTWPFAKSSNGYGSVRVNNRTQNAARYICTLVHGYAPTTSHYCAHSCGNGHLGCVNPQHLRWATPSENVADMALHGTMSKGETRYNAKLCPRSVNYIRANPHNLSQVSLANQFGVSARSIRNILCRITWKHID